MSVPLFRQVPRDRQPAFGTGSDRSLVMRRGGENSPDMAVG
jgi:hypothetical protein